MRNRVLTWDSQAGAALIETYYIHMCGLHKEKASLQKKKQFAMACLRQAMQQSAVQAVVSSFEGKVVGDGLLQIEGHTFSCGALQQKLVPHVVAVYAFALTAGDPQPDSGRVLEQAYYDIGGTALADAARDLLRFWIVSQYPPESVCVSEAFGPGFFGMPAADVAKFFQILDCAQIQLELMPSGFMIPAKSCVGFYLVTDEAAHMPTMDCASCLGRGKVCNYCKAGRSAKYAT